MLPLANGVNVTELVDDVIEAQVVAVLNLYWILQLIAPVTAVQLSDAEFVVAVAERPVAIPHDVPDGGKQPNEVRSEYRAPPDENKAFILVL